MQSVVKARGVRRFAGTKKRETLTKPERVSQGSTTPKKPQDKLKRGKPRALVKERGESS